MKTHQTLFVLFLILALTGCTQPTAAPTPHPTTALPPSPIPSATRTPTLPPPTETAAPVPSATILPVLAPTLTPENPLPVPLGWLAFVDFPSGLANINIARTDGRGARTIVESVTFPEELFWSPDGQWIATVGHTDWESGPNAIYLARPDGSNTFRLTSTSISGMINGISWSPDGRFLVYSQISDWQSRWDLYVVQVSTGDIQQLTNTPTIAEWKPVFSPDGNKIAFFSMADGSSDAYLMAIDANGENIMKWVDDPMINGAIY